MRGLACVLLLALRLGESAADGPHECTVKQPLSVFKTTGPQWCESFCIPTALVKVVEEFGDVQNGTCKDAGYTVFDHSLQTLAWGINLTVDMYKAPPLQPTLSDQDIADMSRIKLSTSPKNILWLPLGDSITWGCGTDDDPRGKSADCTPDAGSYRIPLAWALSQQGFNVSTMGTLHTGPSYVTPQWLAHEGHPGWRIDQIDILLDKSLATSPTAPDLITIHLGTNDCGQNFNISTLNARMVSLLSHIQAKVPKAKVFLASIIAFPGRTGADVADAFNKGLPDMVKTFKAKGMMINYVPMQEWSGVCAPGGTENPLSGLCCNGHVHPTAAGYLRMASAFALAIEEAQVLGELSAEIADVVV